MSMETYLNPRKLEVGQIIKLTDLGRKSIRLYLKKNPGLGKVGAKFKVLRLRTSYAMDDQTELKSPTIGVRSLQDTETKEVFRIEDDNEHFWAFFTESTPHFFEKVSV